MSQNLDERIVSKMKCKFLILFAVAALTALLYNPSPGLADPIMGSELASFAVLSATPDATNTGPTTITGNVGVSAAVAVTGFKDTPLNTYVGLPPGTNTPLGAGTVNAQGVIYLGAPPRVRLRRSSPLR